MKIQEAVKDSSWQLFRETLHNVPLIARLKKLNNWKTQHKNSEKSTIQVTNYINALKRAGMIK